MVSDPTKIDGWPEAVPDADDLNCPGFAPADYDDTVCVDCDLFLWWHSEQQKMEA